VTARLRLDLIVRSEPVDWDTGGEDIRGDRWTWRLWSGSRIVSGSGSQRYSRRIDCARGAEVGAGLDGVPYVVKQGGGWVYRTHRDGSVDEVEVRILDERTKP
jgi:hypothetical protein